MVTSSGSKTVASSAGASDDSSMRVTAVKDAPNRQGQDSQFKPEPPVFDVVEVKLHALANKAGITGWAQVNDLRGETDLPMAHDYRPPTRIPADSPLLRGAKAGSALPNRLSCRSPPRVGYAGIRRRGCRAPRGNQAGAA